jgi:hypothetical protein
MEDPVQKLEEHGYTNLESDTPDEYSYNFGGMDGSLDHVFANEASLADVAGVDIWNVNADESVAFEYSRHNYNATNFYQPTQFRASDHDPEIVGIDLPGFPAPTTTTVAATATRMVYGEDGTVEVTVDPAAATGTVEILDGETVLGTATVSGGKATVTVPGTSLAPGRHTLTVRYLGDEQNNPSSSTVEVTVAKAISTVTAAASPTTVKVKKGTSRVAVTVAAEGARATGRVRLFENGSLVDEAVLRDGAATLAAGPFTRVGTKTLTVRYLGNDTVDGSQSTVTIEVTRSGKPDRH